MKKRTDETGHLRTKIAAGYMLILLLVGGIVYTWYREWGIGNLRRGEQADDYL